MKELYQKQATALKAGDTAEAHRIDAERAKLVLELRRAHVSKLMAEPDIDATVAERYRTLVLDRAQSPDGGGEPTEALEAGPGGIVTEQLTAIGPLLGQLPDATGGGSERAEHKLSAWGVLIRTGPLVNMPLLRFESSFAGPPAMVRWLSAKGCADFRYQLRVGSNVRDEADEDPS
jgi:hypothetical protein